MDECSLVAQEARPLNLLKLSFGMPCASDGTVQFVQISVVLLPLAYYIQLRSHNMHCNNKLAQHAWHMALKYDCADDKSQGRHTVG